MMNKDAMSLPDHDSAWDRVQRHIGDQAFNQLSQKHVVVAGIGSGGGFAALALAMTGVGQFTLIDPDTVSLSNVVRHVADRRDVGRPKVEALADLIKTRNPAAVVNRIMGRLEDYQDKLAAADLMVVGVDDERPKFAINEACRKFNLTAVYAGVYERGEGGDVAVIVPHHGPCYACWSLHLREPLSMGTPAEHAALNYGQARQDGTFEAEPGLWLHVVRVAAAQSDCALNELLRNTTAYTKLPANTLILANRAMEIMPGVVLPPYGAQWVDIPRDPDCLVCGTDYRTDQPLDLNTLAGDLLAPDQ